MCSCLRSVFATSACMRVRRRLRGLLACSILLRMRLRARCVCARAYECIRTCYLYTNLSCGGGELLSVRMRMCACMHIEVVHARVRVLISTYRFTIGLRYFCAFTATDGVRMGLLLVVYTRVRVCLRMRVYVISIPQTVTNEVSPCG